MMIWQIGISFFIFSYLILAWTNSAPPGMLRQVLKPFQPIMDRLHISQIWRNFPSPGNVHSRMWVEVEFANGSKEKFSPFASRHPWAWLRPLAGHKLIKFQENLFRLPPEAYIWIAFRQHLREYASSLNDSAVVKLTLNIERTFNTDWNDRLGSKSVKSIDCLPKSPANGRAA